MTNDPPSTQTGLPPPKVFLSYASEDRPAAKILRDALPAYGVEVWYDESGLAGGDAWDKKIRQQIRECDFFMPVISAQTEARHEGYFRREWRLAVERSHDMADDHLFLLPVVIDDTSQSTARVPEKFLTVQWTRVPGGQPNAALQLLCQRMLTGDAPTITRPRFRSHPPSGMGAQTGEGGYQGPGSWRTDTGSGSTETPPPPPLAGAGVTAVEAQFFSNLPPFPREEPGQKQRFYFEVAGWALHSAWLIFLRLPKWVRLLAYLWLLGALLSKGCSSSESHRSYGPRPPLPPVASVDARKLQQIAAQYHSSAIDIGELGERIAREFADKAKSGARPAPLLAVPFTAPEEDEEGRELANSTFAQIYGRLALSHHGKASQIGEALSSSDTEAALKQARQQHVSYVLLGNVEKDAGGSRLTIQLLESDDGTVLWSKSYPAETADSAAIAAEVDQQVHKQEDD